jgi:small subunit ribosomal protein S23e
MGCGKPRGINAGRKLKNKRRLNRWADKKYNKTHITSRWKTPFASASHAKGIVVEKLAVEAKQPNSAIRKCVRVQLKKNAKKITAFVPLYGSINYINDNDEVLVSGFGRSGHAVGDIPGVRFKVIAIKNKSLYALYKGKAEILR